MTDSDIADEVAVGLHGILKRDSRGRVLTTQEQRRALFRLLRTRVSAARSLPVWLASTIEPLPPGDSSTNVRPVRLKIAVIWILGWWVGSARQHGQQCESATVIYDSAMSRPISDEEVKEYLLSRHYDGIFGEDKAPSHSSDQQFASPVIQTDNLLPIGFKLDMPR